MNSNNNSKNLNSNDLETKLDSEISVQQYHKFLQSLQEERELTGGAGQSALYSAQARTRKKQINKKMVIVCFCFLLTIMFLTWVFAVAFNNMGAFTIVLSNLGTKNLVLHHNSNSEDGESGSRLKAEDIPKMENTTFSHFVGSAQDVADLQKKHTQEENDKFLLYTFSMENGDIAEYEYVWRLVLTANTNNLAGAIRIMIIENAPDQVDDETEKFWTVFAQREADGSIALEYYQDLDNFIEGNGAETVPFESDSVIASSERISIRAGAHHTYTVILWIEGTDPECSQDILGGTVNLEMQLEVIDE